MASIQNIYDWLITNGTSEPADIAIGVGSPLSEVQAILTANATLPTAATASTPFILAGGGGYATNPTYDAGGTVTPPATTSVEDALADILCNAAAAGTCINEVTTTLDAVGLTKPQVQAGLTLVGNFIALSACSGLRNKMLARGVPTSEIDVYFATMQDAVDGAQAWVNAYGAPGV